MAAELASESEPLYPVISSAATGTAAPSSGQPVVAESGAVAASQPLAGGNPEAQPLAAPAPAEGPRYVLDPDNIPDEMGDKWKHDIFDCCAQGKGNCLYSFFCFPCASCDAVNTVTGKGVFWRGLCLFCFELTPIQMCVDRHEVRETRGIEGNYVHDCLYGCLCPCCSTSQLYQESLCLQRARMNVYQQVASDS